MHGTLKSLLHSVPILIICLSLRWISKRMFSLSAERRNDKLCFMVLEWEEVDICDLSLSEHTWKNWLLFTNNFESHVGWKKKSKVEENFRKKKWMANELFSCASGTNSAALMQLSYYTMNLANESRKNALSKSFNQWTIFKITYIRELPLRVQFSCFHFFNCLHTQYGGVLWLYL